MATNVLTRENVNAAVPAQSPLMGLSFTETRADGGVSLWRAAEEGPSWADQCRAGRQRGYEALDYIRATGDAAMLPGIARAITERGTFGGAEVGFFAVISALVARAA